MKKDIIVINTSARSGGALTILKQFIEGVKEFSNKEINYYIFTSCEELREFSTNNIEIIVIKDGHKYKNRVFHEKKYIKKWCCKKSVNPSAVLSLQNIGVNIYRNIPQVIYLHQPIPFRQDLKWSFFKTKERRYWIYKNIYYYLIKSWVSKANKFIVQTNWMKNSLINEMNCDVNKVYIIKPNVSEIDIEKVKSLNLSDKKINLFYPTSNVPYKNYEILFNTFEILNRDRIKYRLYITLEDVHVKELIGKDPKSIGVICIGSIKYDEVLRYYKSVDGLLFPSYLETFGLPLVEAVKFELPVIVSDLEYSREVLKEYGRVKFVKYNSINLWVEAIEEIKKIQSNYIENKKQVKENGWRKLIELLEWYDK